MTGLKNTSTANKASSEVRGQTDFMNLNPSLYNLCMVCGMKNIIDDEMVHTINSTTVCHKLFHTKTSQHNTFNAPVSVYSNEYNESI